MNGIHFYNVIWQSDTGLIESSIEPATSRRWLVDHIRTGDVKAPDDMKNAKMLKVQEFETPVIDFAWLVKTFETGTTKQERVQHAHEAAYVMNLVEKLAARVLMRDEDGEERLIER